MIKSWKNLLSGLSIMFSLMGAFTTADYFGLFGLKKYLVLDFAEASFKPIDKVSGAPVLEVKIKCFQMGNENACTQKENRTMGIITARIPVQKLVWESLLFKNKEELLATNDPDVQMMFVHYNYNNPVETFNIKNLYNDPVLKHPVKMERKYMGIENE